MEDVKDLIRIAGRIQLALSRLRKNRYNELLRQLKCFVSQLQEIATQSRRMDMSVARRWFAAADHCRSRASRLCSDISYSASRIRPLTERPRTDIPKMSALVEELKQLQQEFGNMDFDAAECALSVMTEPITLEDVYLGPFKIQLEIYKLSELYTNVCYHVMALDPNPAATSEDVTHPHVSNEQLCEGEGASAMRAALEEGRLVDFFTMARSILNTYNPDSPYIALHDWDGTPCYDCGYVGDRENSYYCGFCDHDYCEQCSSYCRLCDETVCLGCGGQCPHCEEMVCPSCISRCAECEELCCKECLEEDICPNCKEESEVENEEHNTGINTDRSEKQSQPGNTEIKAAG